MSIRIQQDVKGAQAKRFFTAGKIGTSRNAKQEDLPKRRAVGALQARNFYFLPFSFKLVILTSQFIEPTSPSKFYPQWNFSQRLLFYYFYYTSVLTFCGPVFFGCAIVGCTIDCSSPLQL